MRSYNDRRHTTKFSAMGDRVYLRLHNGYSIPNSTSSKPNEQYAGPFRFTGRENCAAYRPQLPESRRIHDVVSVDILREEGLEIHNYPRKNSL